MVGNPANTNALIAMNNAPDIPNGRFTAMTRLDHNRAIAQLAAKTDTTVNDITRMTIWGNHSATQYPDLFHAEVNGKNAADLIGDQAWIDEHVPAHRPAAGRRHHRGPRPVQRRLGGQRRHRPRPHLGVGHRRGRLGVDGPAQRRQLRRARGTDVVVPGDVRRTASTRSCQGLDHNDYSRAKIDASVAELVEERDTVAELGLI